MRYVCGWVIGSIERGQRFQKGGQHIEGPWATEERSVNIEKVGTGTHFQDSSHKFTTRTQHTNNIDSKWELL